MGLLKSLSAGAVVALLIIGCGQARSQDQMTGSPQTPSPSSQPSSPIDEAKAIAIAKQAVAAQDTWTERAVYEAKRHQDNWVITAWRINGCDSAGKPQFVPGGHRFITIDQHGSVISYVRGR